MMNESSNGVSRDLHATGINLLKDSRVLNYNIPAVISWAQHASVKPSGAVHAAVECTGGGVKYNPPRSTPTSKTTNFPASTTTND